MNHLIEKASALQDQKFMECQSIINIKRIRIEMCDQIPLTAINTLNKKVWFQAPGFRILLDFVFWPSGEQQWWIFQTWRDIFSKAKHIRIKMCGFSGFTCEMEVINTLFLFLTGSLGEIKDMCKVLLTKRLLCISAKFIISTTQ